ncbi:FUSC family protein [Amycolatopsis saalfeldensis]|uniref:Aromatic acid exporter family member 1 n=1 Tax=Amycolatopsis saalfeldensis TaxID=394193 RepID=A0A1H8YJU6_9PSEU|nr:FUSC family protein [Amycolatopsis saalfeldensis]SEP52363.1 Aromatic acid exporter family member 1 [Amycolatopsis saalfeldensis]
MTGPALRKALLSPVRWVLRAVRTSGPERSVLAQAGKAAIAAVAAWAVASPWLHLSQPFLAPYTAVFVIETTVYRSARSALQQAGAVTLGVLLATVADQLITVELLTIAVVVLVGLLIGRWHGFGPSGVWISVTALLLVTYGTAGQDALLADRLVETLLGAVVGFTVNAVVMPPLYLRGPAQATTALADQLTALLNDMNAGLRRAHLAEDAEGWSRRAGETAALVRAAEEITEQGWESQRMNLRRRGSNARSSSQGWWSCLVALRAAWPHIRALAETLAVAAASTAPFRYPTPRARELLADLVEVIADLVRAWTDQNSRPDLFRELGERGHDTLSELEKLVYSTPADELDLAAGLGGLLLPARRAFEVLLP